MIKPDDDFDDVFIEDEDATDKLEAVSEHSQIHRDTRRKIEDILEQRRLREELGGF